MTIKAGDVIRVNTGHNQHIDGVYHVLGVFDDCEIAYRKWMPSSQRWIYSFINTYDIELWQEHGWIK